MLAPPIALHSPAPAPLAAMWVMLRETLLVPGSAGRAAKEAAAAAVSAGNTCPYCVTIHGAVLRGVAGGPVPALIAAGQIESIADPALREIARWARYSGQEERAGRYGGHIPAGQFAEIAGVAFTFHYLNRMVNVFLGESPLPPSAPRVVTGPMMRVLASVLLSSGRRGLVPGAALDLLPAAELPADIAWASAEPRIAAALARAAAAIGAGAEQVVSPAVREVVGAKLSWWNGQAPGMSRAWADEAVAALAQADRAAGRLALLTALASYQVLPRDIEDFREHQPGDDALIVLTSWAAMAAARRISSWLRQPARA
jgi:AhpD family alkylhydroperoxidase